MWKCFRKISCPNGDVAPGRTSLTNNIKNIRLNNFTFVCILHIKIVLLELNFIITSHFTKNQTRLIVEMNLSLFGGIFISILYICFIKVRKIIVRKVHNNRLLNKYLIKQEVRFLNRRSQHIHFTNIKTKYSFKWLNI